MDEKHARRNEVLGFIGAVIAAVLIGTSPIWSRLSEVGEVATAFYRFLFSLPFLGLLTLWEGSFADSYKDVSLTPQEWRKLLVLIVCIGFAEALSIALYYFGVSLTTVAISTLILQSIVIWAPLGAFFLFRERFGLLFVIGFLLSVAGLILVIAGDNFSALASALTSEQLLGDLLSLLSALGFSFILLAYRTVRKYMRSGATLFWPMIFAVLTSLCGAVGSGENLTPSTWKGWAVLVLNGFVSQVLGGILYVLTIRYCPTGPFTLASVFQTISSVGLAWVIFDESLTNWQIVGAVICVVGTFLAQLKTQDLICARDKCVEMCPPKSTSAGKTVPAK
mmetsp:Transcript_13559/g.23237  ORF Transcript_13559/g.23237 Transcript_13559/m.23237 type:complete len:336 (+) Transcript_13559:136-1143(+)